MNELAHLTGADGGLRELALFAGAGGGILGGHILGWRTVCAVEHDPYAIAVLCARQNDGVLPPFPIWDDVCTFDGTAWRGRVDVVSGGFPCQDISSAGRGVGITGERSGLWKQMARIVGEVRPRYVFVENSPMLISPRKRKAILIEVVANLFGKKRERRVVDIESPGLLVILSDLAEMGYDARWGIVGAHHAGAPHKRDRCWIVAHTDSYGRDERRAEREGQQRRAASCGAGDVADASSERGCSGIASGQDAADARQLRGSARDDGTGMGWWLLEPAIRCVADGMAPEFHQHGAAAARYMGRVATGIPARAHQLRCLGNGQVPLAAALAWEILTGKDGW